MLYQKVRPRRFDDVVGQDAIVQNIRSQSKRNVWFQVYILGGQYGSGKTSIGRIIALAATCEHKDPNGNPCLECESCKNLFNSMDYMEIDAASNTGIDNIRELTEWMSYKPIGKKKIAVIDEVHMLSTNAFNGLLKILEEPPHYAIFILCTTDVDSIPLTVQSRSACYSFGRIQESLISKHVELVSKQNEILIEKDACMLIAKHSNGAMRDALQLLEQLSAADQVITGDLCREIMGISNEESIFMLLDTLLCQNVSSFLECVKNFAQVGKNLYVLSNELLSGCSDLIMAAAAGDVNIIAGTNQYKRCVAEIVQKYTLVQFCALSEKVMHLRHSMREDSSQNWFIVNGVAIIQQLGNSNSNLEEQILQLKADIEHLQARPKGQAVGEDESARLEQDESDLIPQPVLPESESSKKAIPKDEFDVNNVATGMMDLADLKALASKVEGSVLTETPRKDLANMPDFVDREVKASKTVIDPPLGGGEETGFFDDFYLGFLETMEPAANEFDDSSVFVRDSEPGSHDVVGNNKKGDVDLENSIAQQAEADLLQLCEENPEIQAHIKVGCKKVYEKDRLLLVTPEQAVCNMLLLYIGRYGIKHVAVQCREM